MSQLIKIDEEYAEWIQSVGTRFKSMQELLQCRTFSAAGERKMICK